MSLCKRVPGAPRHPRHEALWRAVEPKLTTTDLAHDAEHVLRVYRWALRLAPEAEADADLAGAAALVHDLVHVPKQSEQRASGGARSADASRSLLADAGYEADEVDEITRAVTRGSWSAGKAPLGPVGVTLQDADRLDAIGAIGIARSFATAQAMHAAGAAQRLFDPSDPLAQRREADDRRFALDHLFCKLLRLAAGMRLPTARAEAQRRHAAMRTFVDALGSETARDDDASAAKIAPDEGTQD